MLALSKAYLTSVVLVLFSVSEHRFYRIEPVLGEAKTNENNACFLCFIYFIYLYFLILYYIYIYIYIYICIFIYFI